MRAHPSPTTPGEDDGIEFRLFGRQIGHVHGDCSVHLSLTKALKASVIDDRLAQPLSFAPASRWATFLPEAPGDVSPSSIELLKRTQARSSPRQFPTLEA